MTCSCCSHAYFVSAKLNENAALFLCMKLALARIGLPVLTCQLQAMSDHSSASTMSMGQGDSMDCLFSVSFCSALLACCSCEHVWHHATNCLCSDGRLLFSLSAGVQ